MPGSRIKQHREAQGFTQQQMAERLHITQSTYCRIEQKEAHLTIALLKRIADVLQVPALALLPDDLVVHNRQSGRGQDAEA
jgi:transcriptional regulator with XRE-family HTH domain